MGGRRGGGGGDREPASELAGELEGDGERAHLSVGEKETGRGRGGDGGG